MGPKEKQLVIYKAIHEDAKRKAAHDLEARLSGNQATIRQNGIVYTTDEYGTTRFEAHYSTEELLQKLNYGMDIRAAMTALGAVTIHG